MGKSGSWLILIDSEHEVTNEAILGALAKIEGAKVTSSAEGCAVEYNGCTMTVGYDAADTVLAESVDMAAKYGQKHRDVARIARCHRRFVLSFQYDDVVRISNAMCDIESELALLVEEGGGRTFAWNPQTTEFF